MTWHPETYEAFFDARQRPLHDLLARLPPRDFPRMLDAGCGTGKTTAEIALQYPHAQVVGIDASDRMLGHAPKAPRLQFVHADLQTWGPPESYDAVICNAVLHWIAQPEAMVRRLASWVAPGGSLAIQVPANFGAPSHQLIRSAAQQIGIGATPAEHVLSLPQYTALLEAEGFTVDAWETTYLHRLTGADAVLRWVSGTALRPYLAAANKEQTAQLLEALRVGYAQAYPPATDGSVHLPFTRRFVVATRDEGAPSVPANAPQPPS